MSTTIPTIAPTEDVETARDCVTALLAGDREAFGALLHDDVAFRELSPEGVETLHGRDSVLSVTDPFVANAALVTLTRCDTRALGSRVEVAYDFAAGPNARYEIRAFCDVRDGRVAAIDQLCSGPIAEAVS